MRPFRPFSKQPLKEWGPAAASLIPALAGLVCFPAALPLWPLLLPALLFLLAPSLKRLGQERMRRREAREFAGFLDYLSTALSSGLPLSTALSEAPYKLSDKHAPDSRFYRALKELSRALTSGLAPEYALKRFETAFPLEENRMFCSLLPQILHYGGKSDHFVRLTRDRLYRLMELEEEIGAEQSSTSTEAAAMSVMPFAMSFISHRLPYYRELSAGSGLMLIEALMCLSAAAILALCLRFSALRPKPVQIPPLKLMNLKLFLIKVPAPRARRLKEKLPAELRFRLLRLLDQLGDSEPFLWERYLQSRILLLVPGLLIGMVGALLRGPAVFMIGLLLPQLIFDLRLLEVVQKRHEHSRAMLPPLLTLLALLLQSGLNLRTAMQAALIPKGDFSPKSKLWLPKPAPREDDLARAGRLLQGGMSTTEVLEGLALRQSHHEIASALRLIARYEREGGKENIHIIRLQTEQTDHLYRRALQKRMGRRGLKLLIPMGLDLLLVIAVSALPALIPLF